MTMETLKAEAMRLSAKERAELAASLISSLDDDADNRNEQLWLDEAERRYEAYKTGRATAIPVDEALRDARAKLA